MDEILIEEKKYVSSKQAAKMTGYAKDYIGQLCREGRVPARLVGRSWYVLESAIQDHRFGNPEPDQKNTAPVADSSVSSLHQTWESPRYEASETESFPSVNRLQEEKIEETRREQDAENSANLHESWKAWFDHLAVMEPAKLDSAPILQEKDEVEPEVQVDDVVSVPIHVIEQKNSPDEEFLLEEEREQFQSVVPLKRGGWGSRVFRSVQVIGVLLAIISITLAVIGSGYIDEYILSSNQAQIFTGVTVYSR
ncbi:MAG: helix-turn-helix domain-containing protein [Patescibacteria group bacterium]